jgi:hypothetical protein
MLEILLFSQQECCNFLVLGISPRTSWHLTKNLLASHQESLALSTRLLLRQLPLSLGISPRASWPLTKISSTTQEWVRPLLPCITCGAMGETWGDEQWRGQSPI